MTSWRDGRRALSACGRRDAVSCVPPVVPSRCARVSSAITSRRLARTSRFLLTTCGGYLQSFHFMNGPRNIVDLYSIIGNSHLDDEKSLRNHQHLFEGIPHVRCTPRLAGLSTEDFGLGKMGFCLVSSAEWNKFFKNISGQFLVFEEFSFRVPAHFVALDVQSWNLQGPSRNWRIVHKTIYLIMIILEKSTSHEVFHPATLDRIFGKYEIASAILALAPIRSHTSYQKLF
ncbi:hypothetical protein J6590_062962 [Homalodisca vitripennis]|nr:hypothetical protein J6590_062962 [Homalodisca vitripennis]